MRARRLTPPNEPVLPARASGAMPVGGLAYDMGTRDVPAAPSSPSNFGVLR